MANGLTLMLRVQDGQLPTLLAALAKSGTTIDQALAKLGTVHFARTVILDILRQICRCKSRSVGVHTTSPSITQYDGEFDVYIQDFAQQIGSVFDTLLAYVVDGPLLVPVQQHIDAFETYNSRQRH
ncbi:MAG: hypothetical protein JO057_05210 [Chloroflexi bacterium]|nr:hypothetical protein [Chloroflexota bacterium]